MYKPLSLCAISLAVTIGWALPAELTGADRDIQIRSVDFETQVIELFNFGSVAEDLSGWRFCTHDESERLRYSGGTGLNGVSIAPSDSLFIHFANDASQANELNVTGAGGIGGQFATPLDQDAYSIGLYFSSTGAPLSTSQFGNPAAIADHIQWSIDGTDNTSADERSDEAQNGSIWTDQSLWIPTTATTTGIVLNDTTGGTLHGPANYDVIEFAPSLLGDFNNNNRVGPEDYTLLRDGFGGDVPLDNDDELGVPIGPDHYNLWSGNYGNTGGNGSIAAVPEPGTLILLCWGSWLLLPNRSKKRT